MFEGRHRTFISITAYATAIFLQVVNDGVAQQQLFPDLFGLFSNQMRMRAEPHGNAVSGRRNLPKGGDIFPNGSNGPSFNCATAYEPSQISICQHPDLAALDRTMAEAYVSARTAFPGRAAQIAMEQRSWIKQRDACGSATACIQKLLLDRTAALRQETQPPLQSSDANSGGLPPVEPERPVYHPVDCDASPSGQGPSFDCTKAHSGVEIAICRSPILACLDAQLATTYKDAFTRFAYALKDAEKYKQLAWLSERGRCEGNEGCLEKMYRQRLAELSAFAGPLSRDSSGSQNNSRDGASNGLNMSDRRRLTEERQKNLSQCQGLTTFAKFRDCECLADAFMAERIKQGWSVGENAIRDRI